MRVFVYIFILFSFVAFSIWGYKAMIDVRPKGVRRPRLNGKAREVVNALEGYLKGHVGVLAEEIGPRNVFFPSKTSCGNLSVEVLGGSKPEKIVVVGAHYDTIYHSPGANDNGSAVAALLELSRLAKDKGFNWTIRFVAFTNEEPPFFKTRHMGSLVYAKSCRKRKEDIVAMISLETLGYYREEPKTQKYPFPFRFFYPDTGDFLAVVGNLHSKSVVRSFAVSFLTASDFPIECAAPFGFITGIDWSDHWAFWQCGYQAIMLTDTALFRYPYYHSAEDTADKLDYPNLARVTYGVDKALELMINQPSETL
jgi:Zn-dependent M28 family amino/carboxypeptidase